MTLQNCLYAAVAAGNARRQRRQQHGRSKLRMSSGGSKRRQHNGKSSYPPEQHRAVLRYAVQPSATAHRRSYMLHTADRLYLHTHICPRLNTCMLAYAVLCCAVLCSLSAAEEEAAKAAAAEAKKVREAEKKLIKKQRQLLRGIAEGQTGQQRLMSEGEHKWTARTGGSGAVCAFAKPNTRRTFKQSLHTHIHS